MKIYLLLFIAVCFWLPALGEDATPVPQVRPFRTWKVPPDLIPRDGKASDVQWDVREWLEANGASFSPGDEAICNSSGFLMVRAKTETLDLVDGVLTFSGPAFPAVMNLRVEIALVEFSAEKVPELEGEMPYAMLRKAAGDSWHVLNHTVVVTTSGQRAVATSKTGNPEKKPAAPLPGQDQPQRADGGGPLLGGEFGATLEVEPLLNEKVNTIDVNVVYHYRGTGARVWDWKATLPLVVRDGIPMLAQLDSAPSTGNRSQPAKLRALVLRVDVVHPEKTTSHPIAQPASSQPPTAPTH